MYRRRTEEQSSDGSTSLIIDRNGEDVSVFFRCEAAIALNQDASIEDLRQSYQNLSEMIRLAKVCLSVVKKLGEEKREDSENED